jgi:hypothetical protein
VESLEVQIMQGIRGRGLCVSVDGRREPIRAHGTQGQ